MLKEKHLWITGWCWTTHVSGQHGENWRCPKPWHRQDALLSHNPASHAQTKHPEDHPEMSEDVQRYMAPRWHHGGELHSYLWLHKGSLCQGLTQWHVGQLCSVLKVFVWVYTYLHILKSLIFDPFWVALKGTLYTSHASCLYCCVGVHGNCREADTVDSLKIYNVVNNSVLYFTQLNGTVLTDHMNNEILLLLGVSPSTPSLAIAQKVKMHLQK